MIYQVNQGVSIHYMSLVQLLFLSYILVFNLFQYIICHWFKDKKLFEKVTGQSFNTLYVIGSRIILSKEQLEQISFNTLYVIGSIRWENTQTELYQFQYIICHWFKYAYSVKPIERVGFNTLYVIGSNYVPAEVIKERQFQYIICHWFNKTRSNHHYIVEVCFNTLYVIGSICLYIFKEIIINVSIHYMSLVQLPNRTAQPFNIIVSIHYMSLVQFHHEKRKQK